MGRVSSAEFSQRSSNSGTTQRPATLSGWPETTRPRRDLALRSGVGGVEAERTVPARHGGLRPRPGAGRGCAGAGGHHPLHATSAAGDLLQHPAHSLRGRQGAGEDQAPKVRQGAAVHVQVRRHLHPRRRGPPQRQETPCGVQGAIPQPAVLPDRVLRHLQPHQGRRGWALTSRRFFPAQAAGNDVVLLLGCHNMEIRQYKTWRYT